MSGRRREHGDATYLAQIAVLAVVAAGAIFSVYVTYSEFLVTRAVCLWCVGFAAVMAALAVLAVLAVRKGIAGNRDRVWPTAAQGLRLRRHVALIATIAKSLPRWLSTRQSQAYSAFGGH
ncbi:MAG: hypothetical protein M1401_20140 [Chloroflexi bacterium]|nr:hypothetical protein [Chloroflexota bacterium]MCL5111134.1 hypothetical protein [Chloroflexota bacterium]